MFKICISLDGEAHKIAISGKWKLIRAFIYSFSSNF